MRPISLLVLTKSTGGLAFYNKMLLAALDRRRVSAHTLCLSEGAEAYAEELEALGLGAETFPMKRYGLDPTGDLRAMKRVMRIVRTRRPDIVLCHGSKAGFIGRAVGRATGTPAVYCQASLPFLQRVQGAKAPGYWALEAVARGFGGHLVALTESARRTTLRFGLAAPSRISVIRTGIDRDRFRPRGRRDAIKAELGFDPARPLVGWIGRLEPQKAPHDFLDAVERLVERAPQAQFMMAGEGRMRDEIAARVSGSSLEGRIRLAPWQDDPARTLEAFDVFVLSSRWEGLPLILLEAMASGCAPVATAVDGSAEAVEDGDSGRLVAPGDARAMAEAVEALVADEALRAGMAARARRRVEAEFCRNDMVERWTDLLARLSGSVSGSAESPRLEERFA